MAKRSKLTRAQMAVLRLKTDATDMAELNRRKLVLETISVKPVMTKEEFCLVHDISVASLDNYCRDGIGPRLMRTTGRTMITQEAASDWRKAREEATLTMPRRLDRDTSKQQSVG